MFDSHCHLTDPRFAGDVEAVMSRARAAGLRGLVTVASSADDADAAWQLAGRDPAIWCTAGIHPHEAAASGSAFARIVEAVRRPRVVAIGETGLDYHYDHAPRDAQRRSFTRHLELGAETGLPVVVHSRDAEADTTAAIRTAAGATIGVLHCFTGGPELLEAAVAAGWCISFGGMLTFRNFGAADMVRAVPADRLLLETDSPYLAPAPWRGRRNEPAFLAATVEQAARILGIASEEARERTERNARTFYGLAAQAGGG